MAFRLTSADTVFKNGKVLTVNKNNEICQALAIKDNKIIFTGADSELEGIIDDKTEIIDLEGRTLMPGIIDSHFHPILAGLIGRELNSAMIDTTFGNCKTLADMLELLKKAVALKRPGQWISMMGYEPLLLPEQRHPTIEELDVLAPDNPVHCMHGGGHICMYNTKALAYLQVYKPEDAAKFPEDEVEVINGKLTGMVRGHTHFKLWGMVDYSEEQQAAAAMKSHEQALKNGITSVHDAGECDKPSYHIMQKLCRQGTFKVRSYMMLHSIFGKPFSKEDNAHFMDLGFMTGLGDDHFRIGSCKFMIDGGSGGPSCATREPYSHDASLPREKGWEREEVAEYIKLINDSECQATAHAIGDEAVEFMVEGYEKAFAHNPRPDLRHRIEHCTLTDQDLIDRMAKHNICPSVNSGMLTTIGVNYARFYGERMKYLIALRSMLDAGIKVSLGSDYPSGPIGIHTIDGAVNRYNRTNCVQLDQTQCISVLEAVRCATLHGAYLSFEENIKGSLEPGKLADMIILSEDISSLPKERLNEVEVDMTFIDGKLEYSRN
ncbi:MAG: amidohydrolase [Spirochaetales bacterium]|nr:amidohydrolase [Spirochaetales bacterium]